jgi:general secretion pathway protein E
VTGPTGAGKTTTLYSGLRLLNDGARSILTIEDPIEYAVEGVGQSQVNTKVGMTFAAGLRAILRQDPDVVMVGEIRDAETAQIAVQASLTGHLVLSTVHTNDALGALTRLRDFGVEAFLLGSTVRVVLAQRLVRRLCKDCKETVPLEPGAAALLGLSPGIEVCRPVGCKTCSGTGYIGRTGIYEAVRVDEPMRRLIAAGASESDLAELAFANGGVTLADAARQRVIESVTSVEEALRIIRPEGAVNAAL